MLNPAGFTGWILSVNSLDEIKEPQSAARKRPGLAMKVIDRADQPRRRMRALRPSNRIGMALEESAVAMGDHFNFDADERERGHAQSLDEAWR